MTATWDQLDLHSSETLQDPATSLEGSQPATNDLTAQQALSVSQDVTNPPRVHPAADHLADVAERLIPHLALPKDRHDLRDAIAAYRTATA